jgi:hypothetical protein
MAGQSPLEEALAALRIATLVAAVVRCVEA